jgi:branched-chain amino acid aminotransferase
VTDALFETVLVEDGRIRLRDRHLARLAAAGTPAGQVTAAGRVMDELCAEPRPEPVVARVEVTSAGVRPALRPPRPRTPVRLVPRPGYDPGDALRERKRLDRRWAEELERGLEAGEEALVVSADGLAGETTRANVFALVGGVLVTPPVRGLLPGVTRAWVIGEAGARERDLTLAELEAAPAAFVTTAGRGIVPVLGTDPAMADALHRAWIAL